VLEFHAEIGRRRERRVQHLDWGRDRIKWYVL
jgi:hypothetical protein